jgi:hypothetical protein
VVKKMFAFFFSLPSAKEGEEKKPGRRKQNRK